MKLQEDLEWFLGVGETLFERSPTGAMLELLESRAYTSRTCTRRGCRHGIIEEVREDDGAKVGDWCPRCHGTGVLPVRLTATTTRPVTARPTTTAGQSGRSGVEDDRLTRYAGVSRRLRQLPAPLRAAMLVAYGDAGCACATTPWGRSWAVAPLTPAGGRVLAEYRSRRLQGGREDPIGALTDLRRADAARPMAQRSPSLWQATQQAEALLKEAERAWDALEEGGHRAAS